jgi:hypothetical protein
LQNLPYKFCCSFFILFSFLFGHFLHCGNLAVSCFCCFSDFGILWHHAHEILFICLMTADSIFFTCCFVRNGGREKTCQTETIKPSLIFFVVNTTKYYAGLQLVPFWCLAFSFFPWMRPWKKWLTFSFCYLIVCKQSNWSFWFFYLSSFSDSVLRHASSDFKKMGQRIFVFVIGGATRSEVRILISHELIFCDYNSKMTSI